ncbi:hypothetical protein [Leptospira idonii]|uniref:Baseplate protein J-like domain-containing protein n=1 Tax=Leptospira idonii TaxID=1193500 RepID=A0A4R9M6N4_9LEPT|nr:hypothetical protein [Leptospira idonii]TGN20819.1 hypothetical protein EHS15_01920 [Leptospira idonii]
MKNTFKHISRSYFDIFNALKQAYKNYPDWLFVEIAGFFDFLSELINRIAFDILYPKTRESAYGFASRCDYEPTEADGCTGVITATLSAEMDKTVPKGYQFGGVSSSGQMVRFEVTADTTVTASTSINVPVKQQTSYTNINLGTIANTDDWLELKINGYQNIIRNTISLTSEDGSWTRVDNFDNSNPTDLHFSVIYQSNGKCRIQFGNGSTGAKPTINTTIFANFSTTLGLTGQMEAGEINLNVGEDSDIIEVANSSETIGGNNSESVASIIRNSRANVRLRDIVWSQEDLETIARKYSSSVQKVLGIPGIGTAILHIIPAGGGVFDPEDEEDNAFLTGVEDYVRARTQFGVMPVTATSAMYVPIDIDASITVRNGFNSTVCQKLTEFALTLVSCAYDNQVTEYYADNGINKTRTDVINTIWGWSFTSEENDALQFIIETWITLLGDREYRNWGQNLEVGNLWVMGDALYDYGVDIFTLISPTTNQVATSQEIIDAGTVMVTPL